VAAERAKAAADKAAADKAAADKAAADKAAADKAAAAKDAATEPQDSIRAMLSRLAAAQGAASEQQDTLRAMLERLGLRFDGPAPEPAPTTAPPGDWKTRKLFEVPGTITEQMTQGVKDQVLSQLPEGVPFDDFYPEAVISYASGKRPQDCAGAGPGMYYAADLVKLLNGRGVQCFSGLHVPPGKDWKTFMLRLKGHRARAKVLIVVLTAALFESKPCLKEINAAIKAAADGPLKGILGYTEWKNVSSDFNHDPHSSVFHMDQTKVMEGTFVRILSWYDNEWGFSNRMSDTAVAMGKLL
jgi:hypothetical protein